MPAYSPASLARACEAYREAHIADRGFDYCGPDSGLEAKLGVRVLASYIEGAPPADVRRALELLGEVVLEVRKAANL